VIFYKYLIAAWYAVCFGLFALACLLWPVCFGLFALACLLWPVCFGRFALDWLYLLPIGVLQVSCRLMFKLYQLIFFLFLFILFTLTKDQRRQLSYHQFIDGRYRGLAVIHFNVEFS